MSENIMKIEIGQWVVNKQGKVFKVTADDMPELPYEDIARYATKEEILDNGGCPIDLEYRMYFFVPYNLSPIQQGIQAGHALGEFALKYGRGNPIHKVWDFLEKWKTFMVMNGGTSNSSRDFDAIPFGSLNKIADAISEQEIEFAYFTEPDINEALTAVCFIADERVFNKDDYPEFWDYAMKESGSLDVSLSVKIKTTPVEEWEEQWGKLFVTWRDKIIGGHKNFFLRELLRDKKFA